MRTVGPAVAYRTARDRRQVMVRNPEAVVSPPVQASQVARVNLVLAAMVSQEVQGNQVARDSREQASRVTAANQAAQANPAQADQAREVRAELRVGTDGHFRTIYPPAHNDDADNDRHRPVRLYWL